MKKMLLIVTVLIMIAGCSKATINYDTTLNEKDGIYYTKDTHKPYSCPVFNLRNDLTKLYEGNLKGGEKNGEGIKGIYWDEKGNELRHLSF